tara:strand:+ start:1914 stop:2807 length:894 start_codon:yes stop_codon:yes gene_type:complete
MQEATKQEVETEEGVEVEVETPEAENVEVETETEEKVEAKTDNEDQELEKYSDKVQKRIERLTFKMREAERREKAATDYAQSVQKQYEDLKERSDKIDSSYMTEFDNRVKSDEDRLKQKLKEAIESGDVEAQMEAQKQIAKLAVESERLNVTKAEYEEKQKQAEVKPEKVEAKQPPRQQDPKAVAWANKNTWFGQDEPMTLTAFSHHKKIVEEEGIDPTTDDYYVELDKRMRSDFPHKFKESVATQARRDPVAPGSRSSGSTVSKGKVKLSQSQLAIARKLGVSPKQYAQQLALMNN